MEIKSEDISLLSGSLYRTTVGEVIIYEDSVTDFPIEMLFALRVYDNMVSKPGNTKQLMSAWTEPARRIVDNKVVTTYDLWGEFFDPTDVDTDYHDVILARDIVCTEQVARILCSAFKDGVNVIEGRYHNEDS